MRETLENVVDAALQEPKVLKVDINPVNKVHGWLQKWNILPKKKTFVLHPIFLGSLTRISKLLLSIELKIPVNGQGDARELLQANYESIVQHTDKLATIVAIAIHNKKSSPPASLVRFITWNFTSQEMLAVVTLVLQQMDLVSFMKSIISIRGLNVLAIPENANASPAKAEEVSLNEPGGIIAPGT